MVRRKKPTERQAFIINLRKRGLTYDEIGIAYQREFHTKAKLVRERIRQILADFGLH